MHNQEKYIHKINDNKYRIKFLKVDKEKNRTIKFDQYFNGSLEEAIKFRDEKLQELGLSIEDKKANLDIFNMEVKPKKKEVKVKKERRTTVYKATNRVDKYLYEIDKGKKYRIFIRKGATNGQRGDYYSLVFEGTLAQAKKERDKKLAEFKLKSGKCDKSNTKFIDFVRIYYKEYAEKELSPTTVTSGKTGLRNYVLPEIANTPLNKIDALTIQKIINKLKDQDKARPDENGNIVKLSPTSVNGVYRLLRKILNKAVSWDYLETNPVLKVQAPEVSKVEKKSYNRDELIEILDLLKQEDLLTETLFNISICTGIRRGELVGLYVEDIDIQNNVIKVNRSVVWDATNKRIVEKATKTKGSVREVPVPLFCMELIKEYLKLRVRIVNNFKRKDNSYIPPKNLFLGFSGGIMFPDTPSHKWVSFRKKNNLKNVTLHGLRHSYCSMQMNENHNLSPADVQKLMGHSQLSTTFLYTHSNKDKTEQAISVFEEYYESNGEMKINFREILSLYTGVNFTTTDIINDLIKFIINTDDTIDKKHEIIREYINTKYPKFKKIDITDLTVNNLWDWLEKKKEILGDEFIISPIIM